MQNHPNVFTVVAPLSLFVAAALAAPALAGTITLQASGGAAWAGTANTCTYTTLTADGSGNVTVTCQASGGGGGGGGGGVVNGVCGSQKGGTFSTTPSGALCSTGSASTVQLSGSQYSWTCTGSGTGHKDDSCTATYQAAVAGACGATPPNYAVQTWAQSDYTNSTTVITQVIPPDSGVSFQFTIATGSYPNGVKLTDAGSGSKIYSISRCPGGTDGPLLGESGSTSVNGDGVPDNCADIMGGYVRYEDTSGSTPVFYAGAGLSAQNTCFLPTTTTQASMQFKQLKQTN
jgi:hypothetical protein